MVLNIAAGVDRDCVCVCWHHVGLSGGDEDKMHLLLSSDSSSVSRNELRLLLRYGSDVWGQVVCEQAENISRVLTAWPI